MLQRLGGPTEIKWSSARWLPVVRVSRLSDVRPLSAEVHSEGDQPINKVRDPEFEAILARAAEEGAKRALADVGLDCDEAALDIRALRSLVDCIRLVRRTAMQTAVRMITTGVMLALLAGIAIKLKIFGGSPQPRPISHH
jgi:hypothetical protein